MSSTSRLTTYPMMLVTLLLWAAFALVACSGGDTAASDADSSVAERSASAQPTSGDPAAGPSSGTSSGGTVDAAVASMAMERVQDAHSIRFSLVIGMSDLPGYDGDVELTVEGAVDHDSGAYRMVMDFGPFMEAMAAADGQDQADAAMVAALFGDGLIEMRQVGDTAYMRWPALAALFGANTSWVSFPADEDIGATFETGDLLGSQGLLDELASVGVITEIGRDEVFGYPTTHYEARIDYGKAYGSLSAGAPVPLDSPEGASLANLTIPLGLWIDDGGVLRRMTMEFDPADLGLSPAELDGSPGRVWFEFDVIEVGATVIVDAPPAGDVTDMSEIDGGSFLSDLF